MKPTIDALVSRFAALFVCVSLAAVCLVAIAQPANADTPKVVAGQLVAPDWRYDKTTPLELSGDWEVIWGKLVTPETFDQNYRGEYFSIPGRWNDVDHPLMNGAIGVATFRARVALPEHDKELAYHMIAAHSSYQIYIDGQLAVSNGSVSQNANQFKANYVSRQFSGNSGVSEIVMQVSNFSHSFGGPGHVLALWDAQHLRRFLDTLSIIYGLVAGIIFTIGLFHLILFFADQQDDNRAIHGWFCLLCFIIVYRVQGIIPLLHEYYPNSGYWSSLRFPYASLYAAPAVYLLFFRAVFREHFPDKLTLFIVAVSTLFLAWTLFVSEYEYTSTRNFAIFLNVFTIAYSLIFTFSAARNSQPGARVILIANALFLISAIYDAMIYTDQESGFDLTPFGILVLGLGYSYALFLRLQTTFKEAKTTSLELVRLNSELENKVAERTRAFEAAAAKAQNAASDKARFIAAASHDLRQPLHALALFNDALKRKLASSNASSLIEQQESAISNLGSLLQDTLDTARMDVNSKPVESLAIHTHNIRDKLLNSFATRALAQDIALIVDVDDCEIISDPVMLQRVLSNLLDNALKAAKTSVCFSIRQQPDSWAFVVEDDGAGISHDDIELIFDSYTSLQPHPSSQSGGYGLGLYIVREFTRALGGEIAVDSEPEQGAKFSISLPKKPRKDITAAHTPLSDAEIAALANLKVLAVDDDNLVLTAIQALMREWGCDVLTAKNSDETMACLQDFKPDVLLIDFHLQGEDGLQLKHKIDHRLKRTTPSIFITSETDLVILETIKQHSSALLEKPVKPEVLARAIKLIAANA